MPDFICSFSLIHQIPLNSSDVAKETLKDVLLCKVKDLTISGWPNSISDENLKPFFKRRFELSVEQNCILLGNRVLIPSNLRLKVLQLFHNQHCGIVRTKMLVRSYCWWPGNGHQQYLEKFIANAPHNFYRVHVDFFFKFKSVFLLLVDQRSKWIDVKLMENGTNASETISKLKDMFAIFGLPCELVSDNGPPFSSNEFQKFCQANGIKPVKHLHTTHKVMGLLKEVYRS